MVLQMRARAGAASGGFLAGAATRPSDGLRSERAVCPSCPPLRGQGARDTHCQVSILSKRPFTLYDTSPLLQTSY